MNRIFVPLAIVTFALVLASFGVGFYLRSGRAWFTAHFLLGIAAGLAVVLTNSIVATYFIGTSRWCREVVQAYHLDRALLERSTRLKRRAFPLALTNALFYVGILALGAAADPGAAIRAKPWLGLSWTQLHLVAASCGLVLLIFGFVDAWRRIAENHALIEEVLAQVKQIRVARGLET